MATMLVPLLVMSSTWARQEGFADWVELWGSEESAAAAWHEGPPDIPALPETGPGVEIPHFEIRRK